MTAEAFQQRYDKYVNPLTGRRNATSTSRQHMPEEAPERPFAAWRTRTRLLSLSGAYHTCSCRSGEARLDRRARGTRMSAARRSVKPSFFF